MRFHWFHLMPYPFLPDDFTHKYRSVWVDVPSALYDPEKGHWLYNQYLDQLEFADSLGYDGICVNEHHQNAYGLMPSPNLMGAALTRRTSQADNDQEAERLYGPHIDYFFNRCLHVYSGFADAPGYRTQATLKAGFVPQVGGAATAMRATLGWKDFVEHGFVIAGSAATVRETLREALTSMRVGHLMVLLQIGSLPDALTRENTERFAREVMPSLKDLWSEYEDHWYPAPWTRQAGMA